jgi:hypothetical protein
MVSNCWITFESDRALQAQIKRGGFGDNDKPYVPISNFPASPRGYWICVLKGWFRERQIKSVDEGLEISAKVKKEQIQDFIEFAFAGDPSYFDPAKMLTWHGRAYLANQLTDLRAFVAQQLSPRIWYQIHADEF